MKNVITPLVLFLFCISTAFAQPAKRILLEEFTGTWCGGCPEGTLQGEAIHDQYPQQCIQLSWHRLDSLTITENYDLQDRFNIYSYPTGMINRYRNPGNVYNPFQTLWVTNYNMQRSIPAIASVSFSNMVRSGSAYTADVNVEFYSLPESGIPVKINVMLIEDSIPATGVLAQTNYSSAIENGNDPLQNWKHNAVVRRGIYGTWGIGGAVPSMVTLGTVYTQQINFTTDPSWNTDFMHAVAYAAYDQDTTLNHSQILNSEITHLNNFIQTGITYSTRNTFVTIYSNPVKAGESAIVNYELDKSSEIEIAIYNAEGIRVSEPFRSYETAGSHSYRWDTERSLLPVTPGNYFVRIISQKGNPVVKQFIVQ